jgi:aminopeptidase-like protein
MHPEDASARLDQQILRFVKLLFPICRSITGQGVRQTLGMIQQQVPELTLHEVPSGTQAFDWTVPREWNIRDAYVIDPDGQKILDFDACNLHVVGYSTPVDREMELDDLQAHLYSLPEQPDAVPYVTSYYQERWGFCISHHQREHLKPGRYRVRIDSSIEPGHLTFGEVILPGSSDAEVFLSTYICHPSMANHELSGPAVTTYLIKWLKLLDRRRYRYRVVFVPETIGSIVYLSRHVVEMKKRIIAGFNVTCVGDDRAYSFLPSRNGDTLADRVGRHVLNHTAPGYRAYTFLDRGSDERQYCSPGIDLPVATLMRSKFGSYPEYHTSLDNFEVVTASGLFGGYEAIRRCLDVLEHNETYKATVYCEPHLMKRGLYPEFSTKESISDVITMKNFLAYCDGTSDLLSIAERIKEPAWNLFPIAQVLSKHGLIMPV